jgi:hypothetical protein
MELTLMLKVKLNKKNMNNENGTTILRLPLDMILSQMLSAALMQRNFSLRQNLKRTLPKQS